MFRFLLCLTLFSLCYTEASAREFVVDGRNQAAADDNPGSASQPLKTISAAAAKAATGDHVTIHGGDYREVVILTASGTADAPIIFEAAKGEHPVIKGSDLLTGWERDQGAVWKLNLSPLPARGIDGKNSAYWKTNDVRQVFIRDGELLDAERLLRVKTRDEMKAGSFFADVAKNALYLWLADSSSPLEHPPEVSVRGAWLYIYGSHIVIRGLVMRHASTTAIANWPACNLSGNDITLDHCTLTWGDFAAVSMAGKGNRLSRCLVACNGNSGGGGTGENHVIEGCRFLYNNIDRYDTSWHAGGAKFIPNFRHSSIRHNEFSNNLGPGLWLDDQCDDNVIDGNYAHDNAGAGVMVEVSRGNLVINNLSTTNRNLLSGSYRDAEGNVAFTPYSEQRIAPARWIKPYHAGDGRGIYISSSPETKVLHNTAYLNEAEGICIEGPPRGGMETRDYLVENNISVFNHGSQLTLLPNAKPTTSSSDHNLLFSVGALLAKNGWNGQAIYDLKEWQRLSGQDAHSADADPQFALAAMNDFRPLSGSPALAAGQVASEVDHDFLGQPRSTEHPTIGAFEAAAIILPSPAESAIAKEDR